MMTRYLSGLFSCALGLCGGGWLVVTVVLLGGAPTDASLVSLGTGAGVALLSAVGTGCWAVAWRQRMRLDGILLGRGRPVSRGQARRNRRILRRDMRRAARLARRTARLEEKAHRRQTVGGAGKTAEGCCHGDKCRRDECVPRPPGPVIPPFIPQPRVPTPDEAAGGPARGQESPVVLLSELRAILEPLLTTGPLEVLPPAAPRTAEPRTAAPRTAEPRTAEPRTGEPRTVVPLAVMDGEESW
jgi:hypothetical protein